MDTTTPLPELTLRPVAYTHPDATALVERVQAEYVERYGGPDESPIDPSYFDPPAGLFLVGYLDGVPVATGAWRATPLRRLDARSAAEIKRMYVVPEARRRGLSRVVLAELERTAAAAGHDVLVLETGAKQPEAIALYDSAGYRSVPGFGHYCGSELSRHLGKRITG